MAELARSARSAREYMAGKRSCQPSGFMGVIRLSGTLSDDVAKREKWLAAEAKARGFKSIEDLQARSSAAFARL